MEKLNSEEIKYFLTVAECLNFTEASKRLFVSQPAISKWIKHLEKELGLELFKRNTKTVTLTPAGEYLYAEWSVLFRKFSDTISNAYKIQHPKNDSLHIGVMYGLDYDNYLFAKINEFRSIYPNVSTHIHIYNFYELRAKAADLDFILTSSLETDYLPECEHIIIDEMKVYIAMAKEHPLANKADLCMDDLKTQTFFCVSEQTNSKCIQNLISEFKKKQLTPIIEPVDNIQSCLMAVNLNQGVSVIDHKFQFSQDNILLRECTDFSPELYRILIYNKKTPREAAQNFMQFLP